MTFPANASFPTTAHFPGTATFPATATFPSASEVLTLLNLQKLSLPANTPVGTEVILTDAYAAQEAGSPRANGLYIPNGVSAGKVRSISALDVGNNSSCYVVWNDSFDVPRWDIYDDLNATLYGSEEDTVTPDLVTTWVPTGGDSPAPSVTLGHQRLISPPTSIGAFYIQSGSLAGLWIKQPIEQNGRPYYNLVGVIDLDPVSYVSRWAAATFPGDSEDSPGWFICYGLGDGTDNIWYGSKDDVASPDLVTTWVDFGSHGTVPTIARLSIGDLFAGVNVGSDSYVTNNLRPAYGARQVYYGIGAATGKYIVNVASKWRVTDTPDDSGTITHESTNDAILPFDATWIGVTLARNDVASEANWETI